jgi:hypothetical protein
VRIPLAVAISLAVGAGPADASPDDLVAHPLVLDAGAVELRLTAEINIEPMQMGRPLSLAPDAWWGMSPRWTLGLIHSNASLDRIDAGNTFCIRQSDLSTCRNLYRGSGADVRFSALDGPLAVAPRLRAIVRDIEPFKPAVTLGALVRWTHDRFAIISDPYVQLPLYNGSLGNRSALSIPLWLAVQPAPGWSIAAHSGFDAQLAVIGDGWHGPLGLGVTARITPAIELGAEAGWLRLLGPQPDAKRGTALLTVDWHP